MVDFAPGVRIDWPQLQVELAARVVLREGPLELFACSPHTREHESILAVPARPWHIYQALGLIGLEPGQPGTYDEQNDRWVPAHGDRLTIHVRHATPEGPSQVDISEWMLNARTNQPIPPQEWVFCGSRRFGEGTFGADVDGTVICVVDFGTTLIGLPEAHSADNALLWAVANTARVPPRGTACTLVIRAAGPQPVVVEYVGPGRFRVGDRPLDLDELTKLIAERLAGDPNTRVAVQVPPEAPADAGQSAVKAVRALGVGTVRLERQDPTPESHPTQTPDSADDDG